MKSEAEGIRPKKYLLLAFLLPALVSGGCSSRVELPIAKTGDPSFPVYIIHHGKHAGVAVRKDDIPGGLLPETEDFPDADYLEMGWGDREYYQIEDPGVWVTLKAGAWPTSSVLHVVGIEGDLSRFFHSARIVRLDLCPNAFLRLIQAVHFSFDRGGNAGSRSLRKGYYSVSWFYPARGRFHLFHTCNGWVAEILETAGLPMGWPLPITADQLLARIDQWLDARVSRGKYDYHQVCAVQGNRE